MEEPQWHSQHPIDDMRQPQDGMNRYVVLHSSWISPTTCEHKSTKRIMVVLLKISAIFSRSGNPFYTLAIVKSCQEKKCGCQYDLTQESAKSCNLIFITASVTNIVETTESSARKIRRPTRRRKSVLMKNTHFVLYGDIKMLRRRQNVPFLSNLKWTQWTPWIYYGWEELILGGLLWNELFL